MFYVRETAKNGWSRAVLLNFLDTKLHERQGKAVSNFAVALPEADSDLAQEITKDPYCFDFIALTPKYREKELKDAMMAHIEKFLLELGQGFMLVGREFRLEIGTKERFVDLLFFHMNLNRYVVVEVKATEFSEDHLGQLGLYVSAVNHLLKKPEHEPTIGLLVCKTKDNTMVKWALESSQQPIGVSEYRISEILPQEVASDLPSIADIESAVSMDMPSATKRVAPPSTDRD
jgi:predicted nuclease of restriction endonuclease-like (RecB) superfamily